MHKSNPKAICPFCGAEINARARSCPECGSDESTGWSENTHSEDFSLPDEAEYEELVEREFGHSAGGAKKPVKKGVLIRAVVALVIIGLFVVMLVQRLL